MWTQVSQSLHESMARVISRIATLLPGILALILAVLIFAVVAWGLASLVRALLNAMRIDERLVRGTNAIAEWSPTYTPSVLITRVVFWCIVVVGFLVGLEAFGASSDNALSARLLAYLPNVIGAVVLLLLGNVIARFLSRSVLIGAVNMNLHYARLLSQGVKWLVLVLTAAMVLDHLSIGAAIVDLAFGILFGGIVLALALAVGLGSRDLVSRSLERETARPTAEAIPEEQFRHF
jgi:membrane protein YqaA with SNARE-associated domain